MAEVSHRLRLSHISTLHLITELSIGGAQTALFNLLEKINQNRFSSSVACLYNGDGETGQSIRSLKINVTDLGVTSSLSWLSLLSFYRLLCREQPLILHCWLFHADIVGRILGRMAGVPIIITSRRSERIGGGLREQINRWSGGLSDRTIAVSESVRQIEIQRAKLSQDKVVTIHNGIDTEKFANLSPLSGLSVREELNVSADVPLLGSVGRLDSPKGYDDLLTALVKIREQVPNVKLLLVGEGKLLENLRRQAETLALNEAVIFTGRRSDIPKLMSAMDVFVLPSRWEGMPNVLLEAMAARCSVVATRVGGVSEVVLDGVTGLLISPGDPTTLAEGCIRLLKEEKLREQMGQAGHERVVRCFNIDAVAAHTQDLYVELLRKKLSLHYVEQEGWVPFGSS